MLSIALRTALELEEYLKKNYEFLTDCEFCKELVFSMPRSCSDTDCEVVVHRYCVEKMATRQGVKCPGCKRDWNLSSTEAQKVTSAINSQEFSRENSLQNSESQEENE
jgi:hypothetical protein